MTILADDMTMDARNYMPYLSSRPEGSWVSFPQASVTQPLCTPSRATLFTGLYGPNHGITTNNFASFEQNDSTVHAVLHEAGYTTGFYGKWANFTWAPPTWQPAGIDDWRAFYGGQGFFDYDLAENGEINHYSGGSNYSTDVLTARATAFLDAAPEPFFAHLSLYTPHGNFAAAERHHGVHDGMSVEFGENHIGYEDIDGPNDHRSDKPAWLRAITPISTNTLRRRTRKIADAVLSVDEALQSIIGSLSARGALDRTVILFMTDNSNHKGEHGYSGKGSPYESAINAQMMVRWPGAANGENLTLLSNIDVAPTFCAIAGTHMPWSHDGMDFSGCLVGDITPENFRSDLFIMQGLQPSRVEPWNGLRTQEGFKYIEYPLTGETELYDLTVDPNEITNLAADGPVASWSQRLRQIRPPRTDAEFGIA